MDGIGLPPAEMDGTGIEPVELPADPATPPAPAPDAAGALTQAYRPQPCPSQGAAVPEAPPADPRANLGSIRTDSGHVAYVNHWNQWRALGETASVARPSSEMPPSGEMPPS